MRGHVPAVGRNVALIRLFMETNNDVLKTYIIARDHLHILKPQMSRRADSLPLAAMFFSPSLSSFQLPDVTFCPSVTEAFFSSRRSDEDQHAGNRPFSFFHHLPPREELREAQKILGSICTFVSRQISWFAGQQSEFARESENNNLFIIYQA